MCFKIYYLKDLYFNILKKNAQDAIALNIISGYASPRIVEQVINDFPNLKIRLFIGMALEGISRTDHDSYTKLMDKHSQLKIYYKIQYPLTHIKLYQFEMPDDRNVSYVGSANFSKAGFDHNQEILVKSEYNFTELFKEVLEGSLLCDEDTIFKYIIFYTEENDILMADPGEGYTIGNENIDKGTKDKGNLKYNSRSTDYIKYKNMRISRFKFAADADFKIPIMIEKDSFQDNKGINAWVRNQAPYLRQSNKYPFNQYFPLEEEFKILTDSGEVFTGQLTRGRSTQLELYPNIYGYIRSKLSLNEHRPIKYEDLMKSNLLEIWGSEIEKGIYYFDFRQASK